MEVHGTEPVYDLYPATVATATGLSGKSGDWHPENGSLPSPPLLRPAFMEHSHRTHIYFNIFCPFIEIYPNSTFPDLVTNFLTCSLQVPDHVANSLATTHDSVCNCTAGHFSIKAKCTVLPMGRISFTLSSKDGPGNGPPWGGACTLCRTICK